MAQARMSKNSQRMARTPYAIRIVIITLIRLFLLFSLSISLEVFGHNENPFFISLWLVYFCALAYTFVIVTKRLHDINKSGYFSIILLIPFIGAIFSIILCIPSGSDGENNFGE